MKTIVTMDYSGTSIPNNYGNGQAPAFCVCWRYKTIGTNEGDWMLPTAYDLSKYKDNKSTITTVLTNIKTVAGSSYLNDVDYSIFRQWTANESSTSQTNYATALYGTSFTNEQKSGTSNTVVVRSVFIPHIEEV